MATATIGAEFAIVQIVGAMAGSAVSVDRFHFLQGASVAVIASNINMCALEQEFSLKVMVKSPDVPCDRVVAVLAAVLEIPAMWVFFEMTGNTLTLSIREDL